MARNVDAALGHGADRVGHGRLTIGRPCSRGGDAPNVVVFGLADQLAEQRFGHDGPDAIGGAYE